MADIRVNMHNRVDAAAIKVEQIDGEPHLIIPSYTLPDNVVMNGGLYPKAEIDKAWMTLEGTFAPIGHPIDSQGNWLPAASPLAINNFHGGAWNRNVRRDGHRVYAEKVVNIAYAQKTEPGKRLLEAVRYNAETGQALGPEKPIHSSTGLTLHQDFNVPAGSPHKWVATNMRLDHDAILLDEPGAATPDQGVGLLVNCSDAVKVQNLSEDTANARREALDQAIRTRFGNEAWVRDFDQRQVVYRMPDGNYQLDYSLTEAGTIELNGDPVAVKEKTSWVATVIANLWDRVAPSKAPITTNQPGEDEHMPLSQEDLQAIGALIGNSITPLTERLDKQGEAITSLQTNTDQLTAQMKTNAEQQVAADKALVAEKHGQAIADSLPVDKLAEIANALRSGEGGEGLPNGQRQNNNEQGEWGQVPAAQGGK